MSNILKVTTPPTGYENNVKNNPLTPNDKQIQNPVDPGRVVRPDGRTESGKNQDMQMLLNSQTNFGNFVQNVRDIPNLTQLFSTVFFQGMGTLVEAGIGPDFAQEIARFMDMAKLTDVDLAKFVKGQADGAVRYKGAFFDLLRQVMGNTKSVELKAGILDFLKRYNDMASGPHLLKNMDTQLNEISKYMFRSARQTLEGMMQRLDLNAPPGETKENVGLLKEEIIPYLSRYISQTHDRGMIRNLIGLLTFNTSRYENGDIDRLMQALNRLTGFAVFKQKFQGLNEENLMAILQNTDFEKANKSNQEWLDHFINIVKLGVSGEAGLENKQVFSNLMNAVLLNESVYMPLLHIMLPIELNGHMLFSEMWIDPDDESAAGGDGTNRMAKLLIKFDIQNLGFFDVILMYGYGDGKVDLKIFYPENLASKETEIRSGVTQILRNNGLELQSLGLQKGMGSKSISEVFPKIFERSSTVNVTI